MSTTDEENFSPVSKVQQVRQAADSLGISERTVYRRLRSGKLEQLPAGSCRVGSDMTSVSKEAMETLIQDRVASRIDNVVCQNDMTLDKLTALRQDMAQKDAQIRSLLENQQELTLTIQKLQSQIFELARLALQQAKAEEKPEPAPVALPLPRETRRRGLWTWLRTVGGQNRGR